MGEPAATPPARRRLTGEQRRSSFLDAAAELVARHGVEAVTMEGVAAHLGVTKSLGYRYFANRDALLLALFDREADAFDERVVAAVAAAEGLEARLRAVLELYLDEVEGASLLVTQFERVRAVGAPFEQRRRQREATSVRYLAGLVRAERQLDEQAALVAAAVMASGSAGLIGLVGVGRWRRQALVEDFLVMCLGAVDALESARR